MPVSSAAFTRLSRRVIRPAVLRLGLADGKWLSTLQRA
jgi:hypothetical protein